MDSDISSAHEESSGEWIDSDGEFQAKLLRIQENDPRLTRLDVDGEFESVQNMTDEEWEQFGRDIANNTHLQYLCFMDGEGALNDHKMSFLFQGLMRSSSIKNMLLQSIHQLSVAGVRCMVPFLQNANNLHILQLSDNNNLQSEGFNFLFRELRDSPIEELYFSGCGIETPEIDIEHSPKHLKRLGIHVNNISADGCRVVAKLLHGDATLKYLYLGHNKIDDEGVEILVNALQNNTALKTLDLRGNNEISNLGGMMLLKLVNDISSIKATLQSNHTLEDLNLLDEEEEDPQDPQDPQVQHVQEYIDMATQINLDTGMDRLPDAAAGRGKMILMQLKSVNRLELAEMQGVDHSLYSEIDPLHLPEVLALVSRYHGQGEFYVALKSSIAGVISTVSRKECLKQQIAHDKAKIAEYNAKVEAAEAELASLEAAEGRVLHIGSESRSNKKRRV